MQKKIQPQCVSNELNLSALTMLTHQDYPMNISHSNFVDFPKYVALDNVHFQLLDIIWWHWTKSALAKVMACCVISTNKIYPIFMTQVEFYVILIHVWYVHKFQQLEHGLYGHWDMDLNVCCPRKAIKFNLSLTSTTGFQSCDYRISFTSPQSQVTLVHHPALCFPSPLSIPIWICQWVLDRRITVFRQTFSYILAWRILQLILISLCYSRASQQQNLKNQIELFCHSNLLLKIAIPKGSIGGTNFNVLTHRGSDKMGTIFQTTISNTFSGDAAVMH